jgi:5'-deoxynucleotidase YfbR-like HD superfamily hydrolase
MSAMDTCGRRGSWTSGCDWWSRSLDRAPSKRRAEGGSRRHAGDQGRGRERAAPVPLGRQRADHLDAVEGLGNFIELEAVASPDSDLEREQAQVTRLREALAIDDADVIGESYSDLMLSPKASADLKPGSEQGERLERQLEFILELDKLKSVLRQTPLIDGSRRENDAEHSWELATMAVVLAEHADGPIDLPRVVRMLLLHDVVEIDAGDTFLYDEEARKTQAEREERAARRLFGLLPGDQAQELRELWVEFEEMESAEARFARALDRLAPLLHNYHSGGATWRRHSLSHSQVAKRNEIIGRGSPALWAHAQKVLKRAVSEGLLPD